MRMAILSELTSVVFVLFFFSTAVDAKAEESMDLRIFDRDYKMTDKQMLAFLKKTDLESHGYKKEITTKLISEPGSDKPAYVKSFLYFKIVECTRLAEIDQELQTLMPGIFGVGLVTKINREIRSKNLTSMKHCKVGLEVHFKEAEGCRNKKNKTKRRKRDGDCEDCWFCWAAHIV